MKQKKTNMKQKKNLFRVDLNLKYLIYTDKQEYTDSDIISWLKNEMHSGEFDEPNAVMINKVTTQKQIQDFLNMDIDYHVYGDVDQLSVHDVVEPLGLDTEAMIDRLKSLGYAVSKNTSGENILRYRETRTPEQAAFDLQMALGRERNR